MAAGLEGVPGGEGGIRTRGRLLTYTRFPGVRLKPLIHLSGRPGRIHAEATQGKARRALLESAQFVFTPVDVSSGLNL